MIMAHRIVITAYTMPSNLNIIGSIKDKISVMKVANVLNDPANPATIDDKTMLSCGPGLPVCVKETRVASGEREDTSQHTHRLKTMSSTYQQGKIPNFHSVHS